MLAEWDENRAFSIGAFMRIEWPCHIGADTIEEHVAKPGLETNITSQQRVCLNMMVARSRRESGLISDGPFVFESHKPRSPQHFEAVFKSCDELRKEDVLNEAAMDTEELFTRSNHAH